jgi:hypothetical protein
MPFQPIDFANIKPQGNPFFRDLVENLTTGYQAGQLPQQLERQRQKEELANAMQKLLVEQEPQKFGEESQGRQLENALNKFKVQQEPQKFGSEMSSAAIQRALQQANINRTNTMTPLEARELALKNQLYPEYTKSQIANNLALSKQRELGLTGLGAGGKEEYYFQNLTAKSNPQLTPEQVFDASNAIREGKTTLPDGTKINVTPSMISSLDRIAKYGTTSDLISNVNRGKQADAEIGVLNKYIGEAIAPFSNTIAGYSPAQIMATMSNKKDDQIKLGRFAAAQQLQTDAAANQNIINSGRPTASITREILRDSETKIKTAWPRMSNMARQESLRYLKEALDKTLEAKLSVGIGASGAVYPSRNTQNSNSNVEEEGVIDGRPVVKTNGKWHYK